MSNKNSTKNNNDLLQQEEQLSSKEISKVRSDSDRVISKNTADSEKNAAQSKAIAEKYIRNEEAQSKQLANVDQTLKDKYSKQQASEIMRAEAAEIAKNNKIRSTSEAESRVRGSLKNKGDLLIQHNSLRSISFASKGGNGSRRNFSKKLRPKNLIPEKIYNKNKAFKTGKTLIASVIAKEIAATYLKNSSTYSNTAKAEKDANNLYFKTRDEAISDGFTEIEADKKAHIKVKEWKNKHSSKVKKSVHGADSSLKSRDHKLRVEEAAKVATQKYLNELNDKNILVNYMLDKKYTVHMLDQDGNYDVSNSIQTNDAPLYADKSKYKLVQNYEINTYGEMTWNDRKALSIKAKQIAIIEYEKSQELKESQINRPLVEQSKTTREKKRKNSLKYITRDSKKQTLLQKNNKKNKVKVNKKIEEYKFVKQSNDTLKNEIAALTYLVSYAKKPNDSSYNKDKAKAISIAFDNVKNINTINEMIESRQIDLIKNEKLEVTKINDVYDLLNVQDVVSRSNEVANHYNIVDINKLSQLELFKAFSDYRNVEVQKAEDFITDFLQETNEGKEQLISLEALKKNEVLKKYYLDITDQELKSYSDSQLFIDYKQKVLDNYNTYNEKKTALEKKYPNKIFTEIELNKKGIVNEYNIKPEDLDNDGFIATNLLIDKLRPNTTVTNKTFKKDLSAILSVNEILYNEGFKETGKQRLASKDSKNVRTHFDGILSFPTGSPLIKAVELEDMIAALKYRHLKLYEPYDIYDINGHVDEPMAGNHLHFEMSCLNRYTNEYDIREHKTKLVNDFNIQDYTHRQSIRSDFISTLDTNLRVFLTAAKDNPDATAEDLSPYIQVAFEDFIEKHNVEAFNFGKVRPEINNKIINYFNANIRDNHALRAENKPEIELDLVDLTKRIRSYVINEYDRKPIYFDSKHRDKLEQQVFGYHWEAMNTHIIAKEFFGTPDMKKKYPDLVFAMSDVAEEKQNIVVKNYHRQKGYYTDGIKPSYLNIPDSEFIKLVQHNVAKSINPFQAANYQEERELIHQKKMDLLEKQARNLEVEIKQRNEKEKILLNEILKQQVSETEKLNITINKRESENIKLNISIKQTEQIRKRLEELSISPENKLNQSFISEFTMSSILAERLNQNQMYNILDKYQTQSETEKQKIKQSILSFKDNLQGLISDDEEFNQSPNIVLAEFILNVSPIVSDLSHACHLMDTGKTHKNFNPEKHFTTEALIVYKELKEVSDKLGDVQTITYFPFISDVMKGADKDLIVGEFKQYLVDLLNTDQYEFVSSDSDYIDKNDFNIENEEQNIHQITKRLVKRTKRTPNS